MHSTLAAIESPPRIGVVAANHAGYVETMLACLESGAVAVSLRSADDGDRIRAAGVERIVTPAGATGWSKRPFTNRHDDALALISFTSGTEGRPKGVMLTHRNLADPIERLDAVMQVDGDIREYIGAPVYYSFGFGRCRAVGSAGGSFFIPAHGFNPLEIAALLKKGEINAISAVPSLWRLLLQNRDLIGKHGQRVRWIEIGSQYMSAAEKAAMKAVFPQARIVQHYGLTEASRTTLLAVHEAEGEALESVGKAVGEVQVRVRDDGRIAIRGPHVAAAYLIDGEETALVDAQGWFTTNDLGSLRGDLLCYEGRADDIVNCGGIKVDPEALEVKVCASLGYSGGGLAICGRPDRLRGEGFLVALAPEAALDVQQVRAAVQRAIRAQGINAPDAVALVQVPALPRTATGKIQRKQLAAAYAPAAAAAAEMPSPANVTAGEADLRAVFCRVLRIEEAGPADSFVSLGGDSLSYVQLAMELEARIGQLPANWEHKTIAELGKADSHSRQGRSIESGLLLRALAIASVVAVHTELTPWLPGGAELLLLIAGANLARFQADALSGGRWWQPMLALLKHLMLPYLGLSVFYQLWKRELDLPVLLQIGNFFGAERVEIFPTWFINVLVQVLVLFCGLFAFERIRRAARDAPWRHGAVLVGLGIPAAVLLHQLWNTDPLFNRVPHMLFWLFSLGWMIHFVRTRTQKAATAFCLLVPVPLLVGFGWLPVDPLWAVLGGLMLLWVPEVPMPDLLKKPVHLVGAAAYYIYLTHMIFVDLGQRLLQLHDRALLTAVGIVGGVLVWRAVQSLQPWLFRRAASPSLTP